MTALTKEQREKVDAESVLLRWIATRLPAIYSMRVVDRMVRALLRERAEAACGAALWEKRAGWPEGEEAGCAHITDKVLGRPARRKK